MFCKDMSFVIHYHDSGYRKKKTRKESTLSRSESDDGSSSNRREEHSGECTNVGVDLQRSHGGAGSRGMTGCGCAGAGGGGGGGQGIGDSRTEAGGGSAGGRDHTLKKKKNTPILFLTRGKNNLMKHETYVTGDVAVAAPVVAVEGVVAVVTPVLAALGPMLKGAVVS